MEATEVSILDEFEEFIESAEVAKESDRGRMCSAFFSMERVRGLALGVSDDKMRYELLFSRFASIRGLKSRSADLKKLIQRAGDQAREDANRVLQAIQANRVIQQHLPEYLHGELPRYLVPPGFAMDLGGVYTSVVDEQGHEQREKIATAPIILTKRGRSIDDGHQQIEVAWVEFGGPSGGQPQWRAHTVDRKVLFDTKHLVNLISFGAPVTSVNASKVVEWFVAFEDVNQNKIPITNGARRMGWQSDGSFMLPDQHIRREGQQTLTLFPAEGMDPIMSSLKTVGSLEGWLEVMEHLRDHPLALLAVYASAAAPLAHFVGCSNFAVDWSNETSTGKTTSLRVGASLWGKPDEKAEDGFIFQWQNTQVWIERACGFLHSLPLLLDETKTVENTEFVGKTVYKFCFGKGKGRGTLQGVDDMNTWNTVLLSTGEQKLTSFTRDGGVQGRVLALQGAPITGPLHAARETANFVRSRLSMHYGHFGRRVIKYLVLNWEERDTFRAAFEERRRQYGNLTVTNVSGRLAEYVALIDLAKVICESLGFPKPNVDPLGHLITALQESAAGADMPREAFTAVSSWALLNKHRFYGSVAAAGQSPPAQGYVGTWKDGTSDWEYIAIERNHLDQLLGRWRYRFDEVVPRWKARGWLIHSKRGMTKSVSMMGMRAECVLLKRQVVIDLTHAERPDIEDELSKNQPVDIEERLAGVTWSSPSWSAID